MKRKVNQVGTGTLTVSLPNKWVEKHNISKGDELDVVEDGNNLIFGLNSIKKSPSTIHLDVSNLKSMLNRTIAATYKSGFENLTIHYKTPEELKIIQNTIDRSCHIFEIMNIKENLVEVKTISSLDPSEFNNVLRKMSFSVLNISEETIEALKHNDYDLMQTTALKDKIVDRHTDFCRRIINEGNNVGYNKIAPLYVVCEESEILADVFKTLNLEIIKRKIKAKKDILDILSENHRMMKYFYDSLFNFNLENMRKIGECEINIRDMINDAAEKKRDDVMILCHVNNIFETAFEMKSALMTLKLGDLNVDGASK